MTEATLEERIQEVRSLADGAQHLMAYDLADRALTDFPDSVRLKHLAVLQLCRTGAVTQALTRYREYDLSAAEDDAEVAALHARIHKDIAVRTNDPDERRQSLLDAAQRYRLAAERGAGVYANVNAATLLRIAGDIEQASAVATGVLQALEEDHDDGYYHHATCAEALLVLGRIEPARLALQQAFTSASRTPASVATTRTQLRLLCAAIGLSEAETEALFEALPQPCAAHFCGRMGKPDGGIGALSAATVAALRANISATIEAENIGVLYGGLAAGGDLVIAECGLAAGCELHIVMPVSTKSFVEISVASCGGDWVERFERVYAQATSIVYATDDDYAGDDAIFDYGTRLAMGLTLLRGRQLTTRPLQLAIWDGVPGGLSVGTYANLVRWDHLGVRNLVFGTDATIDEPRDNTILETGTRALLFGDLKGFSKLQEHQMPVFVSEVLGRFAAVIKRHEEHVLFRNTWGDGLFLVTRSPERAAAIAFDLQDAMAELDLEQLGLPSDHSLRLGAHYGPVLEIVDPVLGIPNYFGVHVSRAARIEPITPEGEIYVSEAFAAQLALSQDHSLAVEYVGDVPAAKAYGNLRMYFLRR